MEGRKEFIGTCVENPFKDIGTLTDIVENRAKQISRKAFLQQCDIPVELQKEMREYSHDYEFYKSEMPFTKQVVYFYTWSAIEHFYN